MGVMAAPDLEARIALHLRERHGAQAILLVGSRADGRARPGSDWDLYVLVADGPGGPQGPIPRPERFEGEWLDVGVVRLPVAAEAILGVFGPNLQEARVVHDSDGVAQRLLEAARCRYALGPQLSEEERRQRRHAIARTLARMRARRDDPGAFFESVAWLFYVAHRWWYELLHARFSVSVHRALPEIERADPKFHASLMALVGGTTAARIEAAEEIERALFSEAKEDDR
jgi:hypothetical protein